MIIKKHISFLLAIFLLVSNLGFAIDVHFCGGKIASVTPVFFKNYDTILALEENCCASESTNLVEKKVSCCKDKVIHFEKKQENIVVKSFSFQPYFVSLNEQWNPIVFTEFSNFKNNCIISYYCDSNAPPFFKLYHQYIFYA